jgi:hypothetical protein
MSIEYSCRLEDPYGEPLESFSNFADPTDGGGAGLDYVLNVGQEAALLLTLPSTVDLSLFNVDCRLRPFRSIHGRTPYNDNQSCYLLRKKTITNGWYRFTGRHVNSLFTRRIVGYSTGTAFAVKTDNAGDIIKQLARQNIGANIDASRDTVLTSANLVTPGYLSIEPDLGHGVSVTRETARGELLRIFQDLAADSTQSGTYLAFGLAGGSGSNPFELVTKVGQWGEDRQDLVLSPDQGNIENWKVEIDHNDEATVIIAAGTGQGSLRIKQVAVDTARVSTSPFGHIEKMVDVPNGDSAAKVLSYAQASLRQYEPRISFEADLVETAKATRGVHFDLGDIVTARVTVQGNVLQFPCRLDTVYVSVRKTGQRSRIQLTSPI